MYKIVKVLVDNQWYTLNREFNDELISVYIQKLIDNKTWHDTKEGVFVNPNKISGFKVETFDTMINELANTLDGFSHVVKRVWV